MKTYTEDELQEVLRLHGLWLHNKGGQRADLSGADLSGTVLDPVSKIPTVDDFGGLTIVEGYAYGFRTRVAQHVGGATYVVGQTYVAPWFSTCSTSCHPGLYMATQAWLDDNGYSKDRVRVRCRVKDLHRAGDKFRCREFEVLPPE